MGSIATSFMPSYGPVDGDNESKETNELALVSLSVASLEEGECCELIPNDPLNLMIQRVPYQSEKTIVQGVSGAVSQAMVPIGSLFSAVQCSSLYRVVIPNKFMAGFESGAYALSTLRSNGLATTSLMNVAGKGELIGSAGLQAASSTVMVATCIFQAVSFVVGQYHMHIITNHLENIVSSLKRIERRFDISDIAVLHCGIREAKKLIALQTLHREFEPTNEQLVDFDARLRDLDAKTSHVIKCSELLLQDYKQEFARLRASNRQVTKDDVDRAQCLYERVVLSAQLAITIAHIKHQRNIQRNYNKAYVQEAHEGLSEVISESQKCLTDLLEIFNQNLMKQDNGLWTSFTNIFTNNKQISQQNQEALGKWKEEMSVKVENTCNTNQSTPHQNYLLHYDAKSKKVTLIKENKGHGEATKQHGNRNKMARKID